MTLNFFEKRTLEVLLPYKYDNTLPICENARREYREKMINVFDYIIIPIGLTTLMIKGVKKW